MTTSQSHFDEVTTHAYGCAWATRGAVCDCPAFKAWLRDWAAAIADDTRGIDYSRYTAAEGINDEEGRVMAEKLYVTGHSLLHEGVAYNRAGRIILKHQTGLFLTTSGEGFGKCSCGELSPESMPTGAARRRWHREHKADQP